MAKPTIIPGLDARTPLRRAAHELLSARLADLRAFEDLARSLDVDGIHDLRVATRRLRAGLEILCKAPSSEVKSLGDALGAVRDLQVELEWLDTRTSDPEERKRLGGVLRDQLARAGEQLQLALGRWSKRDVPRVLRLFETARKRGRLGGAWGASRLKNDLSALKPRLKALRGTITPDETHALRKKVKKLKYEAELFHEAYPRTVKKWTSALSALQGRLGDVHDADLRCSWLDHNQAASPRLRSLANKERDKLTLQLVRELKSWHQQDRLGTLRRALWD